MSALSADTAQLITEKTDGLADRLIEWRRDFHAYPELGWMEYRTTSIIINELKKMGYDVLYGKDACKEDERMGLPCAQEDEEAVARALKEGADPELLKEIKGGHTGAVAILKNGDGPVIGMRFDIDALPLQEFSDSGYFPADKGFNSKHPSTMHACGHDSHITMGLGVARVMAELKDRWSGTLKILFQPAEEGVRGAKSMVKAGHVDDVDIMLAQHVWPHEFDTADYAPGSGGALATTKYDVNMKGLAAHASGAPQKGKNALLAACTAVLNLYAISRHSGGSTRVSVGKIEAGDTRNIVAEHAHFEMEVRGLTTELNEYMEHRAKTIIDAAAKMYECDYEIIRMGEAISLDSDPDLMQQIADAADTVGVRANDPHWVEMTASEDYAFMMKRVQDNGGKASLLLIFTPSKGGLHSVEFSVDESVLTKGVKAIVASAVAQMPAR